MPQSSGVFKQVAIKREAIYGNIPAAAGAQLLRRTSSKINLAKDTYQSNEIRPDLQIADYRHGVRRVKGSISGELSPKTYADQLSAVVKRDFTAAPSSASLSITIAGTGPSYTVTRAAGSFITDGFKIGDVVRLTAGAFNAANLNKNLWITALTATVATVSVINGTTLVAEGPVTGATFAAPGKKTFVPVSGHTDVSYSIEHFFSDISQSEVFSGCKFDKAAIKLPATGMATLDLDVVGQNITTAATRYFTSPTAVTTTATVAAVNGLLSVAGVGQTTVTSLEFTIDPKYSGDPVVGANQVPTLFAGSVNVTGQFTAYFTDNVLRDLFLNETEASISVVLTTDNTGTADFIAFSLPRVKLGGGDKDDNQQGVVQTFPFQTLLNNAGGTGQATEQTTISIQDSAA